MNSLQKQPFIDNAISLNHVIDLDQAKVIDREGNRVDRWIKEAEGWAGASLPQMRNCRF